VTSAADVSQSSPVHSEALFGTVHDVAFSGDSAFLALGAAGVQSVRLPAHD
jgi:hypothetical protein